VGTIKKIKVCHLASGDLWAGAEVQLTALLTALSKYDELELSAILYNSGLLAERLKAIGIPVRIIEEKDNNPFKLLRKTKRILATQHFHLLHTHRYKENFLGSLAARMIGMKHVVCTVHGMPEPFRGLKNIKSSFYSFLDRQISRFLLEKIIAVSEDIRNTLSKKISEEKLITVHNGIDLNRLQLTRNRLEVRKSLVLSDDLFVIGSVGRMMPVKGYKYLLEAFKIMLEKRSALRLVLVGDGPERGPLEEYAKQLEISKYIIFVGFQPDVAEVINIMDIFVLSSLHEGISISLLESLALGVPVVVTDVGGNPEVVEEGRHGYFVPPRNPQELARTCMELLGDTEKRRIFGEKGKMHIRQNFSKEAMAKKTRRIYIDLLNQ